MTSRRFAVLTFISAVGVMAIIMWVQALRAPEPSASPPPVAVQPPVSEAPVEAPPGTMPVESPAPAITAVDTVPADPEPGTVTMESTTGYRGMPPPQVIGTNTNSEWPRTFARETRDENWASPLEAQIRQSLQEPVSLGRFHISNVECRATLCEVRILARGSLQRAELDNFQGEIHTLPWSSGVTAVLSTGNDTPDHYEAIWIFERRVVNPGG